MIRVLAIAFTAYPVTDVARARAFYEGVLGLKTSATFEHEGKHWIEYDIGPATIAISNMSADEWKPSSDGPSIALEVEDLDAALATVREKAVRILTGPTESGFCRMAIVADPDGNALTLHQRNAR